MKSAFRTFLAVACIAVIAVCAALIFRRVVGRARVDLTEHRLYTLSEGTRKILGKLNQPIKLKLYYSRVAAMKAPEQIRYYNNYYLYVRDLLEEYVGLSGGRLKLNVVDPRPFTKQEDDATNYGIKRFPISEDEQFFFGLVAQSALGKVRVIGFFEPGRQEFVEYDVSKLISSVVRREKRKIGVLSSLPVTGGGMSPYMRRMMRMQGRQPREPWHIISHLRSEYEVVPVKKDTQSIGRDVDFLMVIHPKNLAEKTLFAIDQFVMKGGKLLVFVDPHCYSDRPRPSPQQPYGDMEHKTSSGLNELLAGWGVKMEPGLIAADRRLAVKARVRNSIQPLITYLALDQNCVNPDEVVTAELHEVKMLFGGVLKEVPGAKCKVTPLLQTTSTGNTWKPRELFELRMPDPEAINRAVTDGSEPLMLACRISGKLKTNFPEGINAEAEHKKETDSEAKKDGSGDKPEKPRRLEAVKEASAEAAVLVFADVDMISDELAYRDTFFGTAQVGDNASVVLNAVEFLGGTGDLIAVRSRGRFSRPFVVVDEIEAAANKATAEESQAINQRIARYRKKLRQIGAGATDKDIKLVKSAALAERQKLQKDLRNARKELRALQAGKREKIEALKASLQTQNMVWAPAAVLLIAVVLGVVRAVRAKRYAARRT